MSDPMTQLVLMKGPKKLIHVSRDAMMANKADGGNRPVWTVHLGDAVIGCYSMSIDGPSVAVAGDPLITGSSAWIETTASVVIDGGVSRNDAAEPVLARLRAEARAASLHAMDVV